MKLKLCFVVTEQIEIQSNDDSHKTVDTFLYFIVTQLLHLSDLVGQLSKNYSKILLLVLSNVISFVANTLVSLPCTVSANIWNLLQ